ncbi:hypothetical protein D9M72_620150 [compost metagenome]
MAYFSDGAHAVVGHAVDHHGSAVGAIAFVADFLVVGAVGPARAARNGALDVVFGHIGGGGFVPGQAQARVGVRVGSARARSDGDYTNDFCPELAAFGILATLAVLDIRPLTMTGHNNVLN